MLLYLECVIVFLSSQPGHIEKVNGNCEEQLPKKPLDVCRSTVDYGVLVSHAGKNRSLVARESIA